MAGLDVRAVILARVHREMAASQVGRGEEILGPDRLEVAIREHVLREVEILAALVPLVAVIQAIDRGSRVFSRFARPIRVLGLEARQVARDLLYSRGQRHRFDRLRRLVQHHRLVRVRAVVVRGRVEVRAVGVDPEVRSHARI
jgi:hypothetical protein